MREKGKKRDERERERVLIWGVAELSIAKTLSFKPRKNNAV